MSAKDIAVRPYPLITEAIRVGSWSRVSSLLQQHPEMRGLDVPAFGTWLHYASAHGTLEVVQGLASLGFDIRSTGEREGRSPLALAAANGRAEIVLWLLQNDVALDTSTAIRNPLFGAVLAQSAMVASVLLSAGIDIKPRYQFGSNEETVDAIAFAMMHGARDVARMVAERECGGDEVCIAGALAEGLRIAHAVAS